MLLELQLAANTERDQSHLNNIIEPTAETHGYLNYLEPSSIFLIDETVKPVLLTAVLNLRTNYTYFTLPFLPLHHSLNVLLAYLLFSPDTQETDLRATSPPPPSTMLD